MDSFNLPFKEADLASFGGLILVVPIVVGALKKLFTAWIAGREPMLVVVVTVILGVTGKLTIPGAFGGVGWLTMAIGLLLCSAAAMQVHDSLVNKVLKNKDGGAS